MSSLPAILASVGVGVLADRLILRPIAERLARETPMRTVLRGGSSLPLLVAPAAR